MKKIAEVIAAGYRVGTEPRVEAGEEGRDYPAVKLNLSAGGLTRSPAEPAPSVIRKRGRTRGASRDRSHATGVAEEITEGGAGGEFRTRCRSDLGVLRGVSTISHEPPPFAHGASR